MKPALLLALLTSTAPALAQPMDHAMHEHAPTPPAPAAPAQPEAPTGTDQPPGNAPPPPIAHDRPADRTWNPAEMAAAEAAMMQPPVTTYTKVLVNLAERQFRRGGDGMRWEGEAWAGGLNRFVLKTEGEATAGEGVEQAEVQALWSKALDPWWNLQLGLRQDIRPVPARTWATLGIAGRARYQFDVSAAAFLSDKGDLAARIEASYDQRITQRLILQPRAELNLSAQDMPARRIGAGLSSAELGLRLRYEIAREFAPYVGFNWTWSTGQTAAYARADGKPAAAHGLVAGIRLWF